MRTLEQARPYLISESCYRYGPTVYPALECQAHTDLSRLMGRRRLAPRSVSAVIYVDSVFIAPPALICCRLAPLGCES